MFIVIIGLLLGILTGYLMSIYYDIRKIHSYITFSLVGIFLSLLVSILLIPYDEDDLVVSHINEKYNLKLMEDSTYVRTYIHNGITKYYFYIIKKDGSIVYKNVGSNNVKVYENEIDKAYYQVVKTKLPDKHYLKHWKITKQFRLELHLPKGTIKRNIDHEI